MSGLYTILQRLARIQRLLRVVPDGIRRPLTRLLLPEAADPRLAALRGGVAARLLAASQRESEAWEAVDTIDDWKAFVRPRSKALRASLGPLPEADPDLATHCSRTLRGDGYAIDNLVFSSRPGLWVTANLYRSTSIGRPAPAVVVCHSHHNPKCQAELQDMGVDWARAGCSVLVMDLVGHGERRDHPFRSAADHPRPFRVDRQDYWFRYVVGLQLDLIGESLTGWMAWDLMRGVDLLLSRPEVDPDRIILIGSVAGGGDVAAVTAALDPRIACVVPFNFGRASRVGPGGTRNVDFAGWGSWETTRNLRSSARDGFMPWLILAAVAPRRLIYAHEFGWNPDEDPAWARLRRVYELHGVPERLAVVHGRGSGSGRPPHNTHCNNVGPIHRAQIDPILEEWFGIRSSPEALSARRPEADLQCWTPELERDLAPRAVHDVAREIASTRLAEARKWREALRDRLVEILGDVEPPERRWSPTRGPRRGGTDREETLELEAEPGVRIGLRLLLPPVSGRSRPRVVLGLAQDGGVALLRQRRHVVRGLRSAGLAVCLVDVRGAGPSRHDDETRGRHGIATEVAAAESMLGRSLLGARVLDARRALGCLRSHGGLDTSRVAVWGDSLARPNRASEDLRVPFDSGPSPGLGEPLGAMLALLLALFEPDVRVIHASGGLISCASLLDEPFCHVPRDVIVPGLLCVADVSDLIAALSDRSVRIEASIDGLNRRVADPVGPQSDVAEWIARELCAGGDGSRSA